MNSNVEHEFVRSRLLKSYDVIVIGGGHAGVEAAWAAARMGASTALVTMQHAAIGRMSCNPAIGGIGKGQMVREVDALGGVMGLATDIAGIQFRMLNRSKGPAVWAPRAQADRDLYPKAVQELISQSRNLEVIEGAVERIEYAESAEKGFSTQQHGATAEARPLPSGRGSDGAGKGFSAQQIEYAVEDGARAETRPLPCGRGSDGKIDSTFQNGARNVAGVRKRVTGLTLTDGRRFQAGAVIITTGTFLRAIMHCGTCQAEGGRIGEASAVGLSKSLVEMGFGLGRLKTGTPPRVHRDSIDFSVCEVQPGDAEPVPFSFMNDRISQRQIDCWVTWTNQDVHDLIRANLHRAPMYSGQIQSTGPRYCPSIEDKVVRFADKTRHQVFLEPEGYDNERVYCNGISTSIPAEVQDSFIRQIPGLENARIIQHGYAVEYDFVPTHQTTGSLETKLVGGLFLAGQINGTSGYEEAAGQGIIAGINAVRRLQNEEPVVLGRDESYIGVMIDDLITHPPTEPYRMFTSRAEYRLLLRSDNADQRLTPLGRRIGTVTDDRWSRFESKRNRLESLKDASAKARHNGVPMANWLRRPDVDPAEIETSLRGYTDIVFTADDLRLLMLDAKYSGYVDRQSKQVERFRKLESMAIPDWVDYSIMSELRREAREKFARVAPRTLGQARRISGISPADITVLWVYLTGRRKQLRSASSVASE